MLVFGHVVIQQDRRNTTGNHLLFTLVVCSIDMVCFFCNTTSYFSYNYLPLGMTFIEVFRPDESTYPFLAQLPWHNLWNAVLFTKPDVLKFVATQFTTLPRVDL